MSPERTARRSDEAPRCILVVDDHPIVRFGVCEQIRRNRPLDQVHEAEDHSQALRLLRSENFDLLITDLSLKETGGLDLIKQARILFPDLKVLVISMHDEEVYGPRSLKAGARGYIMKQEAPGKLLGAIETVLKGDLFVSPRLTRVLADALSGNRSPAPRLGVDTLTDRELEIFRMIGEGLAPREISEKLHLSVKTVAAHRDNIKNKLNLESAQKLARYAAQWLLTSGPDGSVPPPNG